MDMPTSAQATAPVTERPPAPAGESVQRGGNGHAVIHRSLSALPGVTPAAPLPATPDAADDWAICCSGGGIRSATYCLGGLQSLDEGGLLGRAKWIVGVSGGSYIAASRALVAHHLPRADGVPPAYARGTPEVDNLRNNTHYIAPDAKTVLVGVLSLLLGATVTFILALAPIYALGHAWGWLLHARGVLTWSGGKATASVTAWTWWLAPAVAAGIALALFLYWWITLVSGSPSRGERRARLVGWAAFIATGIAVLMLAVPPVIAWLYHSGGALGQVVHFFGFGGSGHWSLATLGGLITAIVAVARACQRQLAKLNQPAAKASPPTGFTGKLAAMVRGKLTPWLTSIVIIGVGAFATLLWIGNAARVGYSADQLLPVLVAVGIVLLTRAVVDVNRTSLHDVYRWRLANAYAVTRDAARERASEHGQLLLAEAAGTRLSQLRSDRDDPTLVIATTANINADRTVPPGRGGFCLAFDPDKVTLRGDPNCGEQDVEVDTTDYECLLGHTRFTLFDVVAISGAAFSPLMGAATRSSYRIVFTLTDLRLGVWMPHPAVVSRARAYLKAERGSDADRARVRQERASDSWWTRRTWLLLLWYVSRHPFWHRDPEKQEKREAWLWAHVLRLREDSTRPEPRLRDRLQAAVCWRVMQPTLGLLWAEAVGHTSYRATWVNVTDGGHYDNLGLVEALRRKAKNIVVLDASGDSPHTWFTLGGAMELAWADAGVDIDLNPSEMAGNGDRVDSSLKPGQVLRPWAHGTFIRPPRLTGHGHQTGNGQQDPAGQQATSGNLWVCKLGWWDGAPWDVRAYAAGHSTYPCDSTMQQLYDGAEFDAYHELGACSVIAAAAEGRLPLR
jgi:hypothetical protein